MVLTSPASPSRAPSRPTPPPPADTGDRRSSNPPPRAPCFSFLLFPLPLTSLTRSLPHVSLSGTGHTAATSSPPYRLHTAAGLRIRPEPDQIGTPPSDLAAPRLPASPASLQHCRHCPATSCVHPLLPPPCPWPALAAACTPMAGQLWSTGGHIRALSCCSGQRRHNNPLRSRRETLMGH